MSSLDLPGWDGSCPPWLLDGFRVLFAYPDAYPIDAECAEIYGLGLGKWIENT